MQQIAYFNRVKEIKKNVFEKGVEAEHNIGKGKEGEEGAGVDLEAGVEEGKDGPRKKQQFDFGDVGQAPDVENARAKINIEQLSIKEEVFQVRFIVHKARELSGNVVNPLVRIHFDSKVLRTKAKKGKHPTYNETVLFSVTKSERDMIDIPIQIKIIDAAKSPEFALIGHYKCDLSVAWISKDKNLFYKWFALINPDERQEGMTGYVNVSIQIIPPGDTAKSLPKMRDEEIDVSNNVFFPPGISLQPGQFIVKLYTGEDMPQTDEAFSFLSRRHIDKNKKVDSSVLAGMKDLFSGENGKTVELVDPYAVVEFAGAKVESSVEECTFDPIWNEQMIIPGEFPSMAQKIVIKVYDNDDYAVDDLIATKLLMMNQVSYSSADSVLGFPVTFGPAYISFYGSFREFHEIYDEYSELNFGAKEGVAYRGRVLLEINTRMGPPIDGEKNITPIGEEDHNAVMSNLRRHKYHLFTSFAHGNMIAEKENQVEFEVSIGDYGNKMSPHASPAPSTTQPCNAVYDGTEYHFMPWGRTKPTVILHSQWEDVGYRVEALNTLIWMHDFMVEKMDEYYILERAHAREYELDKKFSNVLTDVLNALKTLPLEPPDEQNSTTLDKNLYRMRMYQIDNIMDEIEGMKIGRLKEMSRSEKVKRMVGVCDKMDSLCFEPQMGIPDVFIWMLSGTKRLAYKRIPINEIMYSRSKFGRGKHCGQTGSFFLKHPKTGEVGAHLTLSLWFGKFDHVHESFKPPRGSEVTVYAETYENEMSMLGNWTTKLLPRPHFSDSTGRYSLPLNSFEAPEGWDFQGEWFISVDRSLTFDNESGLKVFSEDVFQGQTRVPGTQWTMITEWWCDNKGNDTIHIDEVECHEGWQWLGEWEVDTNRAVDPEGWEYALDSNLGNYGPNERSYHLCRRRRWQRIRERLKENAKAKVSADFDPEGWEYSKIFTTKFHPKERKLDMVRRRRYNKKLVSEIPMPVVFKIVKDGSKRDNPEIFNMAPRIINEYDERQVHKYQLRAYLYQARGILGADPTGYSDPYARVIFGNRSGVTKVIDESVSPVWDTTLVLDSVEICGLPEDIAANPPYIVIELFDEDVLSHDRLGRVVCKPVVFNTGPYKPTKLAWFPIGGIRKSKGDLLAAFELFKLGSIELPLLPPWKISHYIVPAEIRPKLQLTRVEILTWGVRSMKDYKMIPIESPHLDIEVGGKTLAIEKIASVRRHPNFASPHAYIDVELPEKEEFLPPINLRVLDNRSFGYTPLVAVATIKDYGCYRTEYTDVETGGAPALPPQQDPTQLLLTGLLADAILPPSESETLTQLGSDGRSSQFGIFDNLDDMLNGTETEDGEEDKAQLHEASDGHTAQGTQEDDTSVEIEPSSPVRSDSNAMLLENVHDDPDGVIVNPAAEGVLSSTDGEVKPQSPTPSVTDIHVIVPQAAIDACKLGADPKVSDKKLEKQLKKEEKLHRKQAKTEAKAQKRHMLKLQRERDKKARAQVKAQYKFEQDKKKKALEAAEMSTDSQEEEFCPDDPDPIRFDQSPTADVPEKAAGLLGMWYAGNTPADDLGGRSSLGGSVSTNRLSRKATRKQQKLEDDEEPHPDDILVSDWWSKYYHCIGADPRLDKLFKDRKLPKLKLYAEELESDNNDFRDLMDVIHLYRPDNEIASDEESDSDDDESRTVGHFKGSFKIYKITEEMRAKAEIEPPNLLFSNLPDNKTADVLVRIYVVAGMNLTPLDFGGNVDPYIWVKCGKTVIDDKANYQTKKTNPCFGKMFQIRASLPRDSNLTIKVYDHDLIGSNDLIGGTTIDLEDRFLSWKRASCGLSEQYIIEKTSKDRWRDFLKPIALLKRMCLLRGMTPPTFKGKGSTLRCFVNGSEFRLKNFEPVGPLAFKKVEETGRLGSAEHRLSLYVLHTFGVVPEHVETRTLYNEDCPGIPQGKLHLWVDIFPYDRNLPPPINISPRIAQKYVLRIIVWNTQDVILEDENIMGEKMSDIFVNCQLEGMKKEAQETDVHYRSLTGEGNFNWRMVYNFDYLLAEQKIVLWQKKHIYDVEATEIRVTPILRVEVYDYDIISCDDIIGWTELNLVSLPSPTKGYKECELDIYDEKNNNRLSIFDKKKIKGFWPVYDDTLGTRELTGKVELEIEVLTEEESLDRPAGKAREEPNLNPTLEPPNRPDTSFNWFTNPWMVLKVMIWRRYKWKILLAILLLLLTVFLALLIYESPGAIMERIFNPNAKSVKAK